MDIEAHARERRGWECKLVDGNSVDSVVGSARVAGNPGPLAKHDSIDLIFKEVKNQEKDKYSEIVRNP
jgi:hypothetical protein